MLKRLLLLFLFSSAIFAQEYPAEYNLIVPKFIPYNSSFEVSLITSCSSNDAGVLLLDVFPSERISLLHAGINAPGISSPLTFTKSRSEFEGNVYTLRIDLKELNIPAGIFFQVLMKLDPENVTAGHVSLQGIFTDGENEISYLGSEKDDLVTGEFTFYKPNKLAGKALEITSENTFRISNNNNLSSLLAAFWIKPGSAGLKFLDIINDNKTGTPEFTFRINSSGMLIIESDKRVYEGQPVFLSSNTWNYIAVYFSLQDEKAEFYCNNERIASYHFNGSLPDYSFQFNNNTSVPYAVDLFRFIKPAAGNELNFSNSHYVNFSSDHQILLEQINFDSREELLDIKNIEYLSIELVKSDAPVVPRAPELNVKMLSHTFELEWSGGDYKHAERYTLEKSYGGGYIKVAAVTADNNNDKVYSIPDSKDNNKEIVFYRIKQENRDGSVVYSTEVKIGQGRFEPFIVEQNFPNPFNPKTSIEFELLIDSEVEIIVYNLEGSEIARLFKGMLNRGQHKFSFDGQGLPSGIYLYKISTPDFTQTRKMILAK